MRSNSELEVEAGAVLCVGFNGSTPREIPREELEQLSPGALILFARNVTDAAGTCALVAAAREAAGGTPVVVVDQEGGRVARLTRGATHMPSMMALGAADDETLAERVGNAIAADVLAFGCTLDFAPVLDLALDPENTVIGTRSFGADPQRVAALGAAFIRGLQRYGVAACAKHFPGHGATAVDSHLALPELAADETTLRHRELVPFARAIAQGVDAIMSAHAIVRALDPSRPATLSRPVLTSLLREELGFEGVCFTDSIEMQAIASLATAPRAAVEALGAGADSVVVSHDVRLALQTRDAIVDAVRRGDLPESRLREAAGRVRRLGARCARAGSALPADRRALAAEVARRAIRVVRGSPFLDPDEAVTVVSFEGSVPGGAEDPESHRSLALALRRRRARAEEFRVPIDPGEAMRAQLRELISMQGAREVVVQIRRAHLHAGQRRAVEAILEPAARAIVVSSLEPFDAGCFPQAQRLLCTYGDGEPETEALADLLSGR